MVTGRLRDEEIIATGGDGHGRTRVSDFDRRMDALAVPFAKTAGYLTSAWPVLTVYDVASTFLNEGAESGIRSAAVETAVLPAGNAGARLGSRIPGPPWVKAIGGVAGGLVGAAVPVVAERAVPRAIEPSGGTLRSADEEDGLEKWFQSLTNDRRDAIRAELESLDADKRAERLVELYDGRSESSARQAAKGGKKSTGGQLANFLATDKVPPTIFGIPVVTRREDYTEADLRFFSEHPEAGGYYSMGDEDETLPPEGPEPTDGAQKGGKYDTAVPEEREAEYQSWRATLPKSLQYEGDYDLRGYWLDPETKKTAVKGDHFIDRYKKPNHPTFSVESKYAVGDDLKYAGSWDGDRFVLTAEAAAARKAREPRGAYPGAWNNPGNVRPGEVVYDGETGIVLGAVSKTPFLTFKTPQNGLDAMGQSIGQMVRVKIPEKYGKDGKFTLGNLISIYAPANDKNDPDEYAKFVSELTGIGLDDELRLDDAKTMSKMLKAMVRKDSGEPHSSWFGDGNYLKAAKKMLVPATKMRTEKGGK